MPSSPDDTAVAELSTEELYQLVHRATRDAVLDAVGTVIIAGIGLVLFVSGLSAAVGALDTGGVVLGFGLAVIGLALMLSPLDVTPSVRDVV